MSNQQINPKSTYYNKSFGYITSNALTVENSQIGVWVNIPIDIAEEFENLNDEDLKESILIAKESIDFKDPSRLYVHLVDLEGLTHSYDKIINDFIEICLVNSEYLRIDFSFNTRGWLLLVNWLKKDRYNVFKELQTQIEN